jgi:DNA (cytosine-5)-methyltransferase 1
MKTGSLFSGYSGLDLAVDAFFGSETVWVSDIDPGACKILAHHWPDLPNLGDITRIDWQQVEPVDILTGGFPCQDLSHAGKRAGLKPGTRSGLWSHMAYAIQQLRPRYVIAENVRGLLSASADSDLEPCPWCLGGSADGEPALRALGLCSRRPGRARVRHAMDRPTRSRRRRPARTIPHLHMRR